LSGLTIVVMTLSLEPLPAQAIKL